MNQAQNDVEVFSSDLSDVLAGETAISDVNGVAGILSYRGFPIEQLVGRNFLSVAWLLLTGNEPKDGEEQELGAVLQQHRELSESELNLLRALPANLHPMLALQAIVPSLQFNDCKAPAGLGDYAAEGLAVVAKLPSIIAAHYRLSQGLEPIVSTQHKSPHADFLARLHGSESTLAHVRTLDILQILQLEHSFNCSTFVSRMVTATQAPVTSVMAAAIGTLSGVLHGGADQAALQMARAIGYPDAAAEYVSNALANKIKIMGMGHREYKTVDPRAKILRPIAEAVCKDVESENLLRTLVAVEEQCQSAFGRMGKPIWANVEFYKGAVLYSLGIPDDYFTAVFSMSRSWGILAHYMEFAPNGRLIRPKARYVGPSFYN